MRITAKSFAKRSLHRLTLEGGLLRVGEGVFRLQRACRDVGLRVDATLGQLCLFARRLQLLRRPAQPADLAAAGLRDEIAHC